MNPQVNLVLRVLCLFAYAAAAARLAGLLPPGWFDHSPLVAAVLLALHAAELPIFFKYVRLYPGSLAASVVLTLLFGLLHWQPLAQRQASTSSKGTGA